MRVKHLEKVRKGNQEGRLLGDDDFADEAMRKSGQGRMRQVRIEEIMELVSDIYSISCTDLGRPGKDRVFAEARAVAAWLIRDSDHLSVTEFGRLVAGRDVSSLCQGINRLLKRAESDEELRDRMQQAQVWSEYP
jgi:chromosomal replication initiation ATPase DnaA